MKIIFVFFRESSVSFYTYCSKLNRLGIAPHEAEIISSNLHPFCVNMFKKEKKKKEEEAFVLIESPNLMLYTQPDT